MRHIKHRPMEIRDLAFLRELAYQAIFVPPGSAPPPRSILDEPPLSHYVNAWGREADTGVIAFQQNPDLDLGAAWFRLYKADDGTYGYIDEHTPEVTIAVVSEHRGQGIGTALLKRLIDSARGHYPALSLSVSKGNQAARLYWRLGFIPVTADEHAMTMRLDLA